MNVWKVTTIQKKPVALTQLFDWSRTLDSKKHLGFGLGNYTRIQVFVITENLKAFVL
jgi:hypothetical protein